MTWLMLLAWMVLATAAALPLASRALPKEERLIVLLTYALVGGHCLQSIVLILLWGAIPLGASLYVTLSISVVAATLFHLRGQVAAGRMRWGIGAADSGILLAMLLAFAFVGFRVFTAAYSAWDAEALYWHSSLVGWMGRNPFPPTSPLEPNDPLRYRFGFHTLAAAISTDTGGLPPEVLASTAAALLPMMIAALVGASIRLFDTPRPGFVSAILGLLGGSLLSILRLGQTLSATPADKQQAHELVSGLLSAGNTLDMLHNNVSIPMGFVAATIALWVSWEMIRQESPALFSVLLTVAALSYLGLVNEVYFAALAPALLVVAATRSLESEAEGFSRWHTPVRAVLVLIVAYAIVSARGGLLGGISLATDAPDSVHLALNVDHLGYVPAPPGIWDPPWIPLFSSDAQIDTDFILLGVPILLLLAWRKRNSHAMLGLLSSAAALVAWTTVYPSKASYDGYRFFQAANSFYLTMAPLVLYGAIRLPVSWSPLVRYLLQACLVALLIGPHLGYAVWAIADPPIPIVAVPASPDYAPSVWLRGSKDTSRVLVPLESDDQDFMQLYYGDSKIGIAMRSILGLSGHAIPIGHGGQYWNPGPYIALYRQASLTFNEAPLEALKIDWVYVLPSQLTREQQQYLRAARDRGDLTLVKSFGVPASDSERLLLKVARHRPKT